MRSLLGLLFVVNLMVQSWGFVPSVVVKRRRRKLWSTHLSDWEDSVRLLGKGSEVVVRPGVVLLSPQDEFNHLLRRAAVFIYGMGLDEHGEEAIRGVILDHPTPFTMGEMAPGSVVGELAHNILWRGGNTGGDSAMLLHSCDKHLGAPIGVSGVFEGGLQEAMDSCNEGISESASYKFFFNYCQFSPKEIQNMLQEQSPDGDAWMSVEVPPEIVLSDDWEQRGDCWKYLRKIAKQTIAKRGSHP